MVLCRGHRTIAESAVPTINSTIPIVRTHAKKKIALIRKRSSYLACLRCFTTYLILGYR
ncbi:hypothetical protein WH47_09721 [Habropoda laboriosa]|uniref:Uncharacterized protein n=1 Tax=Habropoda laboriosa TaxID=597456 RepID=A0A0L7QMA9_9HYME|nr:hypothetical protein WH47_09721 [Habropoda laboriosa]